MRTILRVLALLILLGTIGWWWSAGRNPGWSKDSVAIAKTDEDTGIVYTEYEDRYVPGVEVLGGGVIASVVLAGLTLLRRRKAAGEPVETV